MSRLLVASFVLVTGCSSASDPTPILAVGSFDVPVPSGWSNVVDPKAPVDQVHLVNFGTSKEETVRVMLHPLAEPLLEDPAEAWACEKHAARLNLDVSSFEVIKLPAGAACAVAASKGTMRAAQIVLSADGHALMANCMYAGDTRKRCDEIFQRIKLRAAPKTIAAPTKAPTKAPANDGSELARKPVQRVDIARFGLSIEVPEGTTLTPPAKDARNVNLRQGDFKLNVFAVDEYSAPSFAKVKEIPSGDKLVEWIRAEETPTGWITFKEVVSGLHGGNRFEVEVRTKIGDKLWDCTISAPTKGLAELVLTACQTLRASEPVAATNVPQAKSTRTNAKPRAKAAKSVARVDVGGATSQGALPREVIGRIVRQRVGELRGCYERALLSNATLTVTVTTRFVIDRNGGVSSASASGGDAQLTGCVARAFQRMTFPAPMDGRTVTVTYPTKFAPG